MNVEALLDELAERVATKVLAKLTAPASHYSARQPPPGKSRAWALRTLKTIPGARKVGRDWVVSVSDFDAWLSERDTRKVAPVHKLHAAKDDVEALALATLEASGFRRTR